MGKGLSKKNIKIIAIILFAVYSAVMLTLLFYRAPGENRDLSLVPFNTTSKFIWIIFNGTISRKLFAIKNLVGNVVMFIPLGFFLPVIFKRERKFWIFILTVASLIITVEAIQYFTYLGTADIDDLILNMAGATAGFFINKTFHRKSLMV